ncbi:MAG: DNA-3-methyladenine glycosylase [Actinomycetota bacterium]
MTRRRPVPLADLQRPAPEVAPTLLGKLLVSTVDGVVVAGRITEVEAYTEDDPASHTFTGRTDRNEVMFGRAGRLYVYLSYGIHRCVNVVTGPVDRGEAVLIRALDLVEGTDVARSRRGGRPDRELTNGPGKLGAALGIDLDHDGVDALSPAAPLRLLDDGTPRPTRPLVGPRIGIKKGVDTPWRFRTPPR